MEILSQWKLEAEFCKKIKKTQILWKSFYKKLEYKFLAKHTPCCNSGVSYRNDLEVDRSAEGNYSTELYGAKAAQIIRSKILRKKWSNGHACTFVWFPHNDVFNTRAHNQDQPLFLYLPFQAVHGPLQVPQKWDSASCRTFLGKLDDMMNSYWSVRELPFCLTGMKSCIQTCQIVTGKLTWVCSELLTIIKKDFSKSKMVWS